MSHIVNMLNKRQETDVRRSKGVCDVFGQTLLQAALHHVTLSNMKAVYLMTLLSLASALWHAHCQCRSGHKSIGQLDHLL